MLLDQARRRGARAGAAAVALRERTIELLPSDVVVAEPGERRRFAEQMLAFTRDPLMILVIINLFLLGILWMLLKKKEVQILNLSKFSIYLKENHFQKIKLVWLFH